MKLHIARHTFGNLSGDQIPNSNAQKIIPSYFIINYNSLPN